MKKTFPSILIAISMMICCASPVFAAEESGLSLQSPVDLDNLPDAVIDFNETASAVRARSGSQGDWENKYVETIPDNPGLKHYRWEMARPPYGPYDRIALHRVVNEKAKGQNKPHKKRVIFMIPGTWDAGGWSTLTDPAVNPMLYLANNGYDVYTMTSRNSYAPNMAYEQFAETGVDISGTGDWTYALYREDIKACVEKAKKLSRARTIFLSGFSRGTIQMFIYASKYPEDLKGLISLDGWMKADPPIPEFAVDEGTYNYIMGLFKAGQMPVSPNCSSVMCPPPGTVYQLFAEASWDYYDSWQLAAVVPHASNKVGEALPPEFPTVADFVADDAQFMWQDGIFTNYNAGSIGQEALITAMAEFSRYHPTRQDFENWQLTAWEDVPYFDYDDNEVDLPAIAFLTRLFCPNGVCLDETIPNRTINDDVTIHYLPDYGHIDIIYGADSLVDVKEPLLQWLDAHQ